MNHSKARAGNPPSLKRLPWVKGAGIDLARELPHDRRASVRGVAARNIAVLGSTLGQGAGPMEQVMD